MLISKGCRLLVNYGFSGNCWKMKGVFMAEVVKEKLSYSDKELCAKLGIKPSTLRKYVREGTPNKRFPREVIDLRLIPNNRVAGKRRWNKEVVDRVAAGNKI